MNPISLLLLAGIVALVVFWVRSLPQKKRGGAVILLVLVIVSLAIILMAITGRLHWIGAVFAVLLPFARQIFPWILRLFPFLRFLYRRRQSQQPQAGNVSEVQTRILKMQLDHDAGVMYGQILAGPMRGRELGDLSEQQFIELLQYCRAEDGESARLLEAYLNKRFGDSWQDDDPGETTSTAPGNSHLTRQEAYQILGLEPGCSREEIISAHRRLMQKYHPDRGGSDYLAAKINQAKDCLLNP
ncbi:DnaJ domain-containing protein [Pontibacter sp. JAM-7]|uniref:DnaJ domain-containing protein n=1 Tax=Pontibacter sp. JAM-7 TaxID=3366581 RepID=UPI003AF9248C